MTQERPYILIVDDDERLRGLLGDYLDAQGFAVKLAACAADARQCLATMAIHAIVLDVMMPDETGLAFLTWLRRQPADYAHLPVILLTALGEAQDRIKGLETGANDYLTKPFEPRELVLRLGNISHTRPALSQKALFGEFVFDRAHTALYRGDEQIHLTSGESKFLDALVERRGQLVTREILATLMGVPLSPRTIDVQMARLRKKIEKDARKPLYLCTIRHQGYILKNAQFR